MAAQGSSPLRYSFLGTFALVMIAIGVLFVIDVFLAKTELSESRAEAARLYQEGRDFMQQGHSADAVRQFQAALSITRDNRDYQLSLAEALLAAHRFSNAEDGLSELLQRNSTDGAANLMMARVLVKENRIPEAISYYHRAIYGRWKQNEAGNREKARFELVDLLAKQNSKEELLAELLPLQADGPQDADTRARIGHLFLTAGSPARAADIFRAILRERPQDADAYEGLGQAEFDRGNYRIAQANFQAALRLKPDDEAIRKSVDQSNQVLELDPTRRGLGGAERYRRSVELLEMTLAGVEPCLGTNTAVSLKELADTASNALKRRVSSVRQSEAVEANLDLAEQLWQSRKKECKQSLTPEEETLDLVLAKLAQ